MSNRLEHHFGFAAGEIAAAADLEAEYHEERRAYWQGQYGLAKVKVQESAGVRFVEQEVTGGTRMDLVIDYGDPNAWKLMQEAWTKMIAHREAAERFRSDAALYGSQDPGRTYELSSDDVHYFRLGGGRRAD